MLFTGGTSEGGNPYILAWLAASLGPFFGLIGVEASADVAEETKDARHVIPRTMFYALTASIVIEFLMYVVYVLAIKDAAAVEANSAAPIEEIITQQVGPVITKIVVAVALTNVMACILANILVATRLTYSMARDNMLPFSHVWRHVSPTATARPPTPCSDCSAALDPAAALGPGQREGVLPHPRLLGAGWSSPSYILQTIGLLIGHRKRHHPRGRTRDIRPRQGPHADLHRGLVVFLWCARR